MKIITHAHRMVSIALLGFFLTACSSTATPLPVSIPTEIPLPTNTPVIATATFVEPTPTLNPFGDNVETVVLADGTSVALSPTGTFLGVTRDGMAYKANEAGVVSRDGTFFIYNPETGTLDSVSLPADVTFTPTEYGWVASDNKNVPIFIINNSQLQSFNKNNRVVFDNQAYQWNSKTSLLELVGEAGLSPEGELAYTIRGEVFIKGFDNPYTLIKPEKGIAIEGFTDLSAMGWEKTKDNKWVIYDSSLGLAIETINKEEIDRLKIKPGYENYMNDETFLAKGFFVGYESRSIALDPNKPEGDKGDFIVLKLFVPNNGKGKGVILEYLIVVGVGSKLSFGAEFIGNNKFVITQDGLDQLSVGDYLLTAVADPDKRVKGIQELGFDYYDSIGWSRDVIIQIMEYCKNNPDQPNTAKRIYDMGLENVIIVGEGSLINYFSAP